MKTIKNKTFLAVVATILVAGTALFASCEKENESNQNESTNITNKCDQTENHDYFSFGIEFLNEFYSRCNEFYKNAPDSMLEICSSEEPSKLMEILGYSEEEILNAMDVIKVELDYFFENNPEYREELENIPPCTSCASESLSQLGDILKETDGNMALDLEYRPECLLCFAECLPIYVGSPVAYLLCVAVCNLMCHA